MSSSWLICLKLKPVGKENMLIIHFFLCWLDQTEKWIHKCMSKYVSRNAQLVPKSIGLLPPLHTLSVLSSIGEKTTPIYTFSNPTSTLLKVRGPFRCVHSDSDSDLRRHRVWVSTRVWWLILNCERSKHIDSTEDARSGVQSLCAVWRVNESWYIHPV